MQYFTVKEISDKVGKENIFSVSQKNKRVSIQLVGALVDRICTVSGCAKGSRTPQEAHHSGASVRPRILIDSF